MWPNPQFPADLVSFTEEILNGKLQFLCDELWILKLYIFIAVRNGYPKLDNATLCIDYEKDEICEIFKNTIFTKHLLATASVIHAHHFVTSFRYTLLCLSILTPPSGFSKVLFHVFFLSIFGFYPEQRSVSHFVPELLELSNRSILFLPTLNKKRQNRKKKWMLEMQ